MLQVLAYCSLSIVSRVHHSLLSTEVTTLQALDHHVYPC